MKIFLCGFMGSGKTTLLKKLDNTSVTVLDLDKEILKRSGFDSLGGYIEKIGWKEFRKLEFSNFNEILSRKEDMIVALGGGALNQESWKLLQKDKNNFSIWLNTPFEVCLERILTSGDRPLAKKGKEFLKSLYSERSMDYGKCTISLNQNEQESIKNIKDLISLMPSR